MLAHDLPRRQETTRKSSFKNPLQRPIRPSRENENIEKNNAQGQGNNDGRKNPDT
jgi:hypothetical protein